MLFHSFQFFIFFPTVTFLFFLFQGKKRLFLLIAAGLFFYMFSKPIYGFLPILITIISYFGALIFAKHTGKRRKCLFVLPLILILGVLGFFKYYHFIVDNASWLGNFFNMDFGPPMLSIFLPIGLSFYTFQAASYLIEVYLGKQKVIKNFPLLASFIIFYPTLLAGPIERPQHLIPQITKRHFFNYASAVTGMRWILWGLFKKIVIADRIAVLVNQIYNQPESFQGLPLILATVLYAFQIYYDFSAYAEIALGIGKVMGIDLIKNFERPYYSKTVTEFWRKWNISLSSWLRDYVYIPLGGNRVSFLRHKTNLLLTFLVSGIWHGAGWTFIFWGFLHGFFIVSESLTALIRAKILDRYKKWNLLLNGLQVLITFTLICFAWVFFRANSLHDSLWIINHLFSNTDFKSTMAIFGLQPIIIIGLAILFTELMQYVLEAHKPKIFFKPKLFWLRWAFYYILVLGILFSFDTANQKFIYLQF